jgi:hypothetical protein
MQCESARYGDLGPSRVSVDSGSPRNMEVPILIARLRLRRIHLMNRSPARIRFCH